MPPRPTLQSFIDEELLHAPMTLDLVIDAVQQRWRERLPGAGRGSSIDPARILRQHRNELSARALAVLRLGAQEDLRALLPGSAPARRPSTKAANPLANLLNEPNLALIDEADVAADIEIARCTQAVKMEAEVVLRELQTYTSALVNDANVSRDTNPFRPERMVRALWEGVQQLPMARPLMAAFLQDAAQPLANILQRAYAAACRRLEEQGVEPASYRTIVANGLTAWGQTAARYQALEDLHALRTSMPMPLPPSAQPAPRGPAQSAGSQGAGAPGGPGGYRLPAQPAPSAAAGTPDPQLIELLARLFSAIQTDMQLAPDTVALLQRLQPTALRVALRDPSLLDRYDHALWRFMDQLAHDLTLCAPAHRMRLLGLGRNLVDHLAASDPRDGHGFAWALERLLAAQRHTLNQAVAAAHAEISKLERIAADQAAVTTGSMPLDIATLDTVPAALMGEAAARTTGPLVATGLPMGATVRAYLQGERRTLVSLWQDSRHDLALLHEPSTGQLFAVHQRTLASLQAAGLAHAYKVRSLVRRSADKVMRGL